MRVLLKRGLNDSGDGVADGVILREDGDHAVLDLLNGVRDAIRHANLNGAGLFIYSGFVPINLEIFSCEREVCDYACLRFRADIIIACVAPSATIRAWDVLAGGEWRIGGRPHGVAVEVYV